MIHKVVPQYQTESGHRNDMHDVTSPVSRNPQCAHFSSLSSLYTADPRPPQLEHVFPRKLKATVLWHESRIHVPRLDNDSRATTHFHSELARDVQCETMEYSPLRVWSSKRPVEISYDP